MIGDLLTIVVPTRDRPELLERCVRSVFEYQTSPPTVIVSDNSTHVGAAPRDLEQRYHFAYRRQSGNLTIDEHLNMCLNMARTPWVMLLHDDDELQPKALVQLESVLTNRDDVALIIGGLEYIDVTGDTLDEWLPSAVETFRGDEALVRIGTAFHARSPNTLIRVSSVRETGAFVPTNVAAMDYELIGRLAFLYGMTFAPVRVGRYRLGHEQYTNVDTPERTERHLRECAGAVQSLGRVGCSRESVAHLVDQMVWGLFLSHAARWRDSQPRYVCRLAELAAELSRSPGAMRARAQREYPTLFWRPKCVAHWVYTGMERFGYRLTRPDGIRSHHPSSIWKEYRKRTSGRAVHEDGKADPRR